MKPGVFAIVLTLIGQAGGPGNPRPEDVYCGSYSLFVALKALGIGPGSFEELEQTLGTPGPDGYSMLQLDQAARSYGARTIAVETSLDNLDWRPERFACLTVINDHHYVLLYKIEDGKVFVCDTPRLYDLPGESFESAWSRKALLIGPADFLPEEAIAARRAWSRRGRAALSIAFVSVLALLAWRVGRSAIRRRSAAAASVLLAGLAAGAGCAGEPRSMGVATPTSSDGPTPSLIVEPETRDLGRIAITRPNQTIEASATLRNVGDEPVAIRALVPSCECSEVDVDTEVIEPGGRSTLTATIRLVDNDNDGGTRVVIHGTDPARPATRAAFVWEARNAIRADVRSVDLQILGPGAGRQRAVPIALEHLGLCRDCVFRVSDDLPDLECSDDPGFSSPSTAHTRAGLPDEGLVGRIVLDVAPSDEVGHRKGVVSLALRCGDEDRALLSLPVTWRVESAIAARPGRLYLGRQRPGGPVARTFLVSSTEGNEFSLLDVRCSTPGALASAVFDDHPAMTHAVTVEIEPPPVEGAWAANLIIDTDDERAPRVTVPIAGVSSVAGMSE